MGVTGLWRLIDASGKPVPLETLEGKVLAIDISIWIYQVVQGYQDRRGNAIPNAHLLGLFNRICKLLYFKIKPVFVFDGGVPLLKKNTIATRKKHKAIAAGKAEKMKNDLLHNLMKHSLVKGVLANQDSDNVEASSSSSQKSVERINDMFRLPLMPDKLPDEDESESESESFVELSPRKQAKWKGNIHSVDVNCDDFKALPVDVRYDILTDLKETRKQNSWGRLYEMPQESHQFSSFQMKRLLKRRKVQESLEEAEQEMGGKNLTLEELEKLMTEQGVNMKSDTVFRIAADSTTRLIYINDPKALKSTNEPSDSGYDDISKSGESSGTQISESLPSTSEETSNVVNNIQEYDLEPEWDSDIELIEEPVRSPQLKKFFGKTTATHAMNPALAYMIEHSGIPQDQILAMIKQKNDDAQSASSSGKKLKRKGPMFGNKKKKVRRDSESSLDSLAEVLHIKEEIPSPDRVSPVEESSIPEATALSSESDADFVEVNDVPIPFEVPEKKLEITVKPKTKSDDEEDIFSDVFDAEPATLLMHLSSDTSELSISRENTAETLDIDPSSHSFELHSSISDHPFGSQSAELNSSSEKELIEFNDMPETIVNIQDESITPSSSSKMSMLPEHSQISLPEIKLIDCAQAELSKVPIEENVPLGNSDFIHDNPGSSKNSVESHVEVVKAIVQNKLSERVESIVSRLEIDKEELLAKAHERKDLQNMKSQLEVENQELREHVGKLERQTTEITDQMREEAQDLLRLFGIPYVVAPQEAEAQCAYLEMINLTDGTITDDSDIWLFGGRCVYRNFFNNAKRVMQFCATDIEHHFKLTRQQMIQLALLVGSDYTVGVSGIGPVTAMEVLANFPAEGEDLIRGLSRFATWLRTGRVAGPVRAGLRTKLKNVAVDKGFPNQAVVQAYLFPTVDESKTPFSWSKPNLVLLGDYVKEKFGWTKLKFEETIGPVIKKMEDKKSQKNLLSYFKVQAVPASVQPNLSKRVQKAVKMMGNELGDDEEHRIEQDEESTKKRRKAPVKKKKGALQDDEVSTGIVVDDEVNKNVYQEEKIPQREKDRAEALKKKQKAIEVFKKLKKVSGKTGKKRTARKIIKEAVLSESSGDSN